MQKRGGKKKKTKDDVNRAAEKAIAAGMSWRDFVKGENPGRTLEKKDMDSLELTFKLAKERKEIKGGGGPASAVVWFDVLV